MDRPRMTTSQFKHQWKKAHEEIAMFVHMGIELQSLHREMYEGVIGEPAPRIDIRAEWDEDEPEREQRRAG